MNKYITIVKGGPLPAVLFLPLFSCRWQSRQSRPLSGVPRTGGTIGFTQKQRVEGQESIHIYTKRQLRLCVQEIALKKRNFKFFFMFYVFFRFFLALFFNFSISWTNIGI